jgi:dTDP-4-dehydrorhamnose 3,5-epimerase
MNLTPLGIEGAWLAESPIWDDDRGFFREWFKSNDMKAATGKVFEVAQANVSLSSLGTLRGIHYSISPGGQAKWITCVSGSIKDVIVDISPKSKNFGKWIAVDLDCNSGKSIYIGEGLGHGFLALKENTCVAYLVSTPFSPKDELEINPLDKKIGIDWGMDSKMFKISEKDRNAPDLLNLLANGKLPNV